MGEAVRDADKEGRQHQEGGQVHGDDGFEEEGLEVVGAEGDDADEDGGHVDGQHGGEDATAEGDVHLHAVGEAGEGALLDKVLDHVDGAGVGEVAGSELDESAGVAGHLEDHGALLGVEGEHGHVELADELRVVDSGQGEGVLGALKGEGVLQGAPGADGVVALPVDGGEGLAVDDGASLGLGVVKHDPGHPDLFDEPLGQGVEVFVYLEVEHGQSAVKPRHGHSILEYD